MTGPDGEERERREERAAWLEIIRQFEEAKPPDGRPAPWPDREDLPGPDWERRARVVRHAAPSPPDVLGQGMRLPVPGPGAAGEVAGSGSDEAERPGRADGDASGEAGDHFVPPPPPLPHLDPVTKGAWAAIIGGPGYLIVATAAGWQLPGWAAFCAVAAFVGGFATAVLRMSDEPRGDGPDDGAVV
jgi:hypothetical protein